MMERGFLPGTVVTGEGIMVPIEEGRFTFGISNSSL